MTVMTIPACTAENAADIYVGARLGSASPVWTGRGVRALRSLLIDCELSDRELADLVAKAALANGLNVRFDGEHEEIFKPIPLT